MVILCFSLFQLLSPLELGKTLLIFIPKKDNPPGVKDFRPIALCNVVCKLLSKMLANRIKPFLQNLISSEQSVFVQGRTIHDNILIANELVHTISKSKGKSPLVLLKLDIEKIFDSLSWDAIL